MDSVDSLRKAIVEFESKYISQIEIHPIRFQGFDSVGIEVDALRLDKIHTHISGNKWFKLKYALLQAFTEGYQGILSFGGAHSNHLYALAAAGKIFGIPTVGIVRGEELSPESNFTLKFCAECGMKLKFVDRNTYRNKNTDSYRGQLQQLHPDSYILPEGGSASTSLKGVAELWKHIPNPHRYTHIVLSVGSGGTLAGLIHGHSTHVRLLGIAVVKGDFLTNTVGNLLPEATSNYYWRIQTQFEHGGYAKSSPHLNEFIQKFIQETGIIIEPLYTGKSLYAIQRLASEGYFEKSERILWIHTGGLRPWS